MALDIEYRLECDTEGCGSFECAHGDNTKEAIGSARSLGWTVLTYRAYCPECTRARRGPEMIIHFSTKRHFALCGQNPGGNRVTFRENRVNCKKCLKQLGEEKMGNKIKCSDIPDEEAEKILDEYLEKVDKLEGNITIYMFAEFITNLPDKERLIGLTDYMGTMEDGIAEREGLYTFNVEKDGKKLSFICNTKEAAEEHQKIWMEKRAQVSEIHKLEAEVFMFERGK